MRGGGSSLFETSIELRIVLRALFVDWREKNPSAGGAAWLCVAPAPALAFAFCLHPPRCAGRRAPAPRRERPTAHGTTPRRTTRRDGMAHGPITGPFSCLGPLRTPRGSTPMARAPVAPQFDPQSPAHSQWRVAPLAGRHQPRQTHHFHAKAKCFARSDNAIWEAPAL